MDFFIQLDLSLSVAKKQMIDSGVVDVTQLGIIGAVLIICLCNRQIYKWISC